MAAMDDVPREILQSAYQRKSIYLLKVPLLYSMFIGCGVLLYEIQGSAFFIPVGILCSLLVTNLMRGLGSVAHDAVHGVVFKSKTASYWLGLLCWSPTAMSYTIYSNYHLHHHRITNTYPDVDNFVVTDYTKNPFFAKVLLLAVYSFAYPIYFLFQMFRYTKRLSTWKKIRMNLELAAVFSVIGLGIHFLPGPVFFFLYGLPFIFGAALASTTSLIEHFQMDPGDDDAYSSRTYATEMPIMNFLWNNLGYHNEHHKYPGIPYYNLKKFHEAAVPYYDAKVKAEIYPNFIGLVFQLWGRILRLDISKIEAKYAHLNRDEERAKHMELAGITPVNVA
jgi:fatty acid desaturase